MRPPDWPVLLTLSMSQHTKSVTTSADGYVEDAQGSFGWRAPDEQFCFVNNL
jgi:hypothetical protein